MKSLMLLRPCGRVGTGTATAGFPVFEVEPKRIGEAAARQPDLAEQCRQHHAHPNRLLAVLGALQRLRAGDQCAPPRCAPRKRDDLVGRKAADRRRPDRVFRLAVAAAQQIILEPLVADAEPIEEGAVVPSLADQSMGDAQHQRDIGTGPDRMPDRPDFRRQIVAQRADQVEFDPAIARRT